MKEYKNTTKNNYSTKKINLFNSILIIFSLILLSSIFIGCQNNKVLNLKQQELFTLNYGNFENELTMFNLSNPSEINTYIYMQDGFFYIANGEAKKVMQFTSYGDIIGVYYNSDSNPKPSFLPQTDSNSQDEQKSTQQTLEYPFNKLGKIVSDNLKNWYIVDQLPVERQEFDNENKLSLKQVILRFNAEGKFLDYLGQQGPGGTPFPYIRDIYTNSSNELIVVCQTNTGFITYWFSEAGFLKYTIPINISDLPILPDIPKDDLFISLDSIIPDRNAQKLYVKVDYQCTTFDPSTKAVSGIDYLTTHLYPLDINKGTFSEPLIIPAHEYTISDGFSKLTYNIPFDFLGVSDSGWLFFMLADEKGFIVQLVQLNGQRVLHRRINMDLTQIQYYNFTLSSNGIISAIQVEKDNAKVSWWRTDNLIESLLK